jgi:hypothetical protein
MSDGLSEKPLRSYASLTTLDHPCDLSLLPHFYQDRTNQHHLAPLGEYLVVWFLVQLGCLRWDYRNFVNRSSR